ncbi:MAG: hypothetical protein U1C48_05355 [Methylotenera sp.]|nr:hypothetical protein [Methylotenera sp.]
MLHKIVIIIFVGVVSMTSAVAMAALSETTQSSTKSLTVTDVVTSEEAKIQTANVGNNKNQHSASQGIDKNDTTLPASGWLLVMALFGFLLLSNRTGV